MPLIIPNQTTFLTLLMLILFSISSQAQIPADYTTKLQYLERKEVTYEIPGESDLKCLTLSELSRYHGYMQFYKMDEYVTPDGDLVTDQQFIEEQNVRDDWMDNYGRILCGTNTIDVYNANNELIHQTDREISEDEKFLTPTEASEYGFINFTSEFYSKLSDDLLSSGANVSQTGDRILATGTGYVFTLDKSAKTGSLVEYDKDGVKAAETLTTYELNHSKKTYFPRSDTKIEWFLSENGCCVRKTTQTTRYQYTRTSMTGSQPIISDEGKDDPTSDSRYDVEILVQTDGSSVQLQSHNADHIDYKVIIYDLSGKTILEQLATTGTQIKIPQSARSGIYLIHVYHPSQTLPTVSKVILPGTSHQDSTK